MAGNSTTRVHVWLHVSDYVPAGHRAKVTVSVIARPANSTDTGRGGSRRRHVSFHYVVMADPPGPGTGAGPVCVLNSQHTAPCGRERCESLNFGIKYAKYIFNLN